jgi:hypothetical protein
MDQRLSGSDADEGSATDPRKRQVQRPDVPAVRLESTSRGRPGWKAATVASSVAALVVGGVALISLLPLWPAVIAVQSVHQDAVQSRPLVPVPVSVAPPQMPEHLPVAAPPAVDATPVTSVPRELLEASPTRAGQAVTQVSDAVVAPVGTLRLFIKPWARVLVDGRNEGASPPLKRLTLPVGRHRVEVVNPAFTAYSTDLDIQKDQALTLSFEFK